MARHNPTNPDEKWALSPQQELAADLLAAGKSITGTAKSLELTRQTISGWTNHHPAFQAALNQKRRELWQEMVARLHSLLPQALDVLEEELEREENRLTAALNVIKAAGLYNLDPPHGTTDPEVLELEEKKRVQSRDWEKIIANTNGL